MAAEEQAATGSLLNHLPPAPAVHLCLREDDGGDWPRGSGRSWICCLDSGLSSFALHPKAVSSFQLQSSEAQRIFVLWWFPQRISCRSLYGSSRSLPGSKLTGLAVSCPPTIKPTGNQPQPHIPPHTWLINTRVRAHAGAPELEGRKATEQKEGSSRKWCSHFIRCLLCSARRHKVQIKGRPGDYPGGGLRWAGCSPAGDGSRFTSASLVAPTSSPRDSGRAAVVQERRFWNNFMVYGNRKQETGSAPQKITATQSIRRARFHADEDDPPAFSVNASSSKQLALVPGGRSLSLKPGRSAPSLAVSSVWH